MKILALSVFVVAGLALTTSSLSAGAIRTEDQFVKAVVGKKIVAGRAWVIVSADGTFTGKGPENERISGAWVWNGRYWCRNVIVGEQKWQQDCQTVKTKGNTVTFTREKGRGLSTEWTVE